MIKAQEHFNDRADQYEILIQKIIPNHRIFFGTTIDFIPKGKPKILELGSGTGFVTEMILKANPQAEITCIDMTPEMLAVAKSKEQLEGVTFIEGDFREVWPEGQFDAVISTLCFHHLPDADRASMIGLIYDSLSTDGCFINGDVFRPESLWEEEVYKKHWHLSMQANELPDKEADGMIKKRENSYTFVDTFNNYRDKMASAGFERILCPYTYGTYGIFVGFR